MQYVHNMYATNVQMLPEVAYNELYQTGGAEWFCLGHRISGDVFSSFFDYLHYLNL